MHIAILSPIAWRTPPRHYGPWEQVASYPGEYLLFLGRIHHDKGTKEAISIARKAGLPLLIAGIVQDKAYFDSYVRPEIDGRIIHFLGEADPAQRDRLLGAALALLHPINFEEPFGLSVAESMLCGTPVIAFRRGSMPELIILFVLLHLLVLLIKGMRYSTWNKNETRANRATKSNIFVRHFSVIITVLSLPSIPLLLET